MDSSDCKKVPEEGIVAREDVLYVIVGLEKTKVTAAEESSVNGQKNQQFWQVINHFDRKRKKNYCLSIYQLKP